MGYYDSGGSGGSSQPVDADLTAIAALATTAYGRSFLTQANAAQAQALMSLGTAATSNTTAFDAAGAATTAQAAAVQRANHTGTQLASTISDFDTKRATPRVTAAAYAASITPDCSTTDVLNIAALTGGLTLNAPAGTPVDGQTLRVRFIQDGTGNRVVTYNAIYAFGTDVTAALDPTTAGSKWERLFTYCSADSKWRASAVVRGF